MEKLPQLFTGVVGIAVLILSVVLSIYWLLFPWFVYRKMDKLIARVEALEKTASDAALVQRNFLSDARGWMKEGQLR
jgi:hypothetical protein